MFSKQSLPEIITDIILNLFLEITGEINAHWPNGAGYK